MSGRDRIFSPLVAARKEACLCARVGAYEGARPPVGPIRRLIPFLPSLRFADSERAELTAWLQAALASAITFEPLAGGRWRIGQGDQVRTFTEARVDLELAHRAWRAGAIEGDNAARNRLRRAADWIEREARAPVLADKLRGAPVRACAAYA